MITYGRNYRLAFCLLLLACVMLFELPTANADLCSKFSNCYDCIAETLQYCYWCPSNASCMQTAAPCAAPIASLSDCPCTNGGRITCQKCVEDYPHNHCEWCPTVGCNVDTAACAAPQINATSKCPTGGNNLPAWKIVLIILGVAGGLTLIVCIVAAICFCGIDFGAFVGWKIDEAQHKDPILPADRSRVRKYHSTT